MMYYTKFREMIVERGYVVTGGYYCIFKHKFSELCFNHFSKHKWIKFRVKKAKAYVPGGMHPPMFFEGEMIMHLSPSVLEDVVTRLL